VALGPLVVGQQSSPGMTAVICDKLLFNKVGAVDSDWLEN
jgi:hypothetical protein